MRTTLTLDPDVAAKVKRGAKKLGKPLKKVINAALRGFTGRVRLKDRTWSRSESFGRKTVSHRTASDGIAEHS